MPKFSPPAWIFSVKLRAPALKPPKLLVSGLLKTEAGKVMIACGEDGAIHWASLKRAEPEEKMLAGIPVRRDQRFVDQILAAGKLTLAPYGTAFQFSVWQQLVKIPLGKTRSYGEIAAALAHPRMAARAVGQAVGANPIVPFIPCHRVLAAGGLIGGYSGGLGVKARLLALEGVELLSPKAAA